MINLHELLDTTRKRKPKAQVYISNETLTEIIECLVEADKLIMAIFPDDGLQQGEWMRNVRSRINFDDEVPDAK